MRRTTKRPKEEPAVCRTPTLHDHLIELRGRLFWVTVAFLAVSGLAYPNFSVIMRFIVQPLGDHKLYYLTPAGGMSFMIKVCLYVGIIAVLPVIIYHLYRFTSPIMKKPRLRAIVLYTIASTVLAFTGVAFAYCVSLPAAISFLTGISLQQVSDLLTVDSYLSFVMAYLIAGALLFQLPLLMLIINRITPTSPRKLLSLERYVIVASFVVAAVMSPTPDVVNQTVMAAPILLMYQVGVLAVWVTQRRAARSDVARLDTPIAQPPELKPVTPRLAPTSLANTIPKISKAPQIAQVTQAIQTPKTQAPHPTLAGRPYRSIDGLARRSSTTVARRRAYTAPVRTLPVLRPQPSSSRRPRSIDGLLYSSS